jgi:putative SOS response-associated peptidase YedK
MCCRYTLTQIERLLVVCEQLGIAPPKFALKRRYNIAPAQRSPVALVHDGVEWAEPVFGFTPNNSSSGASTLLINARSETMSEKPAFRDTVKHRRCLVPADGFYEWEVSGCARLPHYFQLRDQRAFFFAGLWQPDTDGAPYGFVIVTTAPNALVARIHHRMPLILTASAARTWLSDRSLERDHLDEICRPFPAEQMTSCRVRPTVNNARHDAPDCIAPVENDPELPLRFT